MSFLTKPIIVNPVTEVNPLCIPDKKDIISEAKTTCVSNTGRNIHSLNLGWSFDFRMCSNLKDRPFNAWMYLDSKLKIELATTNYFHLDIIFTIIRVFVLEHTHFLALEILDRFYQKYFLDGKTFFPGQDCDKAFLKFTALEEIKLILKSEVNILIPFLDYGSFFGGHQLPIMSFIVFIRDQKRIYHYSPNNEINPLMKLICHCIKSLFEAPDAFMSSSSNFNWPKTHKREIELLQWTSYANYSPAEASYNFFHALDQFLLDFGRKNGENSLNLINNNNITVTPLESSVLRRKILMLIQRINKRTSIPKHSLLKGIEDIELR